MGFGSCRKLRRRAISAFLFLWLNVIAFAQSDPGLSFDYFQQYQQILKMQGSSKNVAIAANADQSLFTAWLDTYRFSVSLLFHEQRDQLPSVMQKLDDAYRVIKKADVIGPWPAYALAENRMQKTLLHLRYAEYWSAFWTFRETIRLNDVAFKKHPLFSGNAKLKGTLEILQSSVPEEYKSLASLLGMKGDYIKGSALLKSIPANDVFFVESVLISKFLEDALNKPKTDLNQEEKQLFLDLDENPLSLLLLVRQAMHEHRDTAAIRIIASADSVVRSKIPLIHYLQAELLLRSGQWSEASQHYQKYLRLCPQADLSKDAWYKMGLCAIEQNEPSLKRNYWENAKKTGFQTTEADRYAEAVIYGRELGEIKLQKVRYLIDGGYYLQAKSLLDQLPKEQYSVNDQLEWHYRYARLLDESGSDKEAIEFYKTAINLCPPTGFYQGPNAILLLAQIYQAKGEKKEMNEVLTKLSKFRKYPYQKSIKRKAKTLAQH